MKREVQGSMKEEQEDLERTFSASDSEWIPTGSDVDSDDSEQHPLERPRKSKKRLHTSTVKAERKPTTSANPTTTGNTTNSVPQTSVKTNENNTSHKILNLTDLIKIGVEFDNILNVMSEQSFMRNRNTESRVYSKLLQIKNKIKEKFTENNASNEGNIERDIEKSPDTTNGESKSLEETNQMDSSQENVLISNTFATVEQLNAVTQEDEADDDKDEPPKEWIPIGSGTTVIHHTIYDKIDLKSYRAFTRGLLRAVFSRRVLATHSLSGRKAPAFQHKPVKMSLDYRSVTDIIEEVLKKFPDIPESCIRTVITTKCADEAKMLKTRNKKAEAEASRALSVNES